LKPRVPPRPAPKPARSTEAPDRRTVRTQRWLVAALCAIALLAYADSLGLGLALDSRVVVLGDSRIRGASAENLSLILGKDYWWPKAVDRLYRPVTTLSFLFNYAILGNGENPAGYHFLNLLLHMGNALLLYSLALRLFARAGPAFFAAALWAAHPIGTECVANIAGRADLLATMAILGGLLFYTRMKHDGGPPAWRRLAVFFAIAVAAVFSKETGATLVGLMLLWDLAFAEGPWRASLVRRLPAYAAAGAALALLGVARLLVFRTVPWPQQPFVDNPAAWAGFWTARLTALKALGIELGLLVWPLHLSSDRSYNQIPLANASDAGAWIALAAIVAILAVVVYRRKKDPLLFWAAGFLGITLLPVSNLIVLIGAISGERFLYLPSVGFAVALVALAYRLRRPKATQIALCALLTLYCGRTMARNLDWDSEIALATADLKTAPNSFRLHEALARALFLQDRQRNLDRAIAESEKAWSILRDLPPGRGFYETPAYLGMYYALKGEAAGGGASPDGRAWYAKALAMLLRGRDAMRATEKVFDQAQLAHGKPIQGRIGMPDLYVNMAVIYGSQGRLTEMVDAYRQAQTLDPAEADVYDSLAQSYVAQGNLERAAVMLIEKTQVDGYKPATLAALQQLYARIPGGGCAMAAQGGEWKLNPQCPLMQSEMCLAWADLAHVYMEGRRPQEARFLRDRALGRYGCPAEGYTGGP
jgi:tetratricopeptide (TPR) repeat protein